jgi:hypothetical protein
MLQELNMAGQEMEKQLLFIVISLHVDEAVDPQTGASIKYLAKDSLT